MKRRNGQEKESKFKKDHIYHHQGEKLLIALLLLTHIISHLLLCSWSDLRGASYLTL